MAGTMGRMAARKKRRKSAKSPSGNGVPLEYRALSEAYHDACYAVFLKEIEEVLSRDPHARRRLDRLILEFRKTVLGKLKF